LTREGRGAIHDRRRTTLWPLQSIGGYWPAPTTATRFFLPALGEKELALEGDLRGLRLTFCPRPTGAPAGGEVAAAAEKTARLLGERGVNVVLRKEPLPRPPLDALRVIFRAAALADAASRTRPISGRSATS
jgi:hypothetical protein